MLPIPMPASRYLFLLLSFTGQFAFSQGEATGGGAKGGTYVLPQVLQKPDGQLATTAKEWEQVVRPRTVSLFAELVYGTTPPQPVSLRFEVVETKEARNGQAIRKRVNLWVKEYPQLPPIELLLYVPKAATKPVPVFVCLNFVGNHGITEETDLPVSDRWMPDWGTTNGEIVNHRATEKARGMQTRRWPLDTILARGYAVATAYYGDIEPDHRNGWRTTVRSVLGDTTRSDRWGAIGAWAWGMSRMLDYLQIDPAVNACQAIALGHSRHSNAALWAAVQDKRFAMAVVNDGGMGAGKILRRRVGSRIDLIPSMGIDFWWAPNFLTFANREADLPMDVHQLLACVAPRPLYVASASADASADPEGTYLSAYQASEAYRLYGLSALTSSQVPPVQQPIKKGFVGHHIREGGHDILLYDWQQYLDFADYHFKKLQPGKRRGT
jgi:hypothetical protein